MKIRFNINQLRARHEIHKTAGLVVPQPKRWTNPYSKQPSAQFRTHGSRCASWLGDNQSTCQLSLLDLADAAKSD